MKTEKKKMLAGELYFAGDPELTEERKHTRLLFQRINQLDENEKDLRMSLFYQLFGKAGKELDIEPPFYCDYGYNIELGDRVFINFNCCILDVCKVTIGDRVMLGPKVQIYTATHPMQARERGTLQEYGSPVTIGDDVWIGGGAIINPGVQIGDRVVIGAGAVVTKDLPPDVFVGGNPARVIRKIDNQENIESI